LLPFLAFASGRKKHRVFHYYNVKFKNCFSRGEFVMPWLQGDFRSLRLSIGEPLRQQIGEGSNLVFSSTDRFRCLHERCTEDVATCQGKGFTLRSARKHVRQRHQICNNIKVDMKIGPFKALPTLAREVSDTAIFLSIFAFIHGSFFSFAIGFRWRDSVGLSGAPRRPRGYFYQTAPFRTASFLIPSS